MQRSYFHSVSQLLIWTDHCSHSIPLMQLIAHYLQSWNLRRSVTHSYRIPSTCPVHVLCSLRNWCPCLEKAQVKRGGTMDESLACRLETTEFWRVMVSPWVWLGEWPPFWLGGVTYLLYFWEEMMRVQKYLWCSKCAFVMHCAFVNTLQFFRKSHWANLFSTDTFLNSNIVTRSLQFGLPLMLLFLIILWTGRRDRWQEKKKKQVWTMHTCMISYLLVDWCMYVPKAAVREMCWKWEI